MNLAPQDSLRLNVLLSQNVHAVRIDESKNIVYAITDKGEAKVVLSPTCKDGMYIKMVKELFSSNVLGSPGGYPVFLKRWTRMGQANDNSLENLLKLGEPEAVQAVIHAEGLTAELARRAWWCQQSAENARKMLQRPAVAASDFGKELADFILEFMSYEESQKQIIDSIKVILQPGLISEQQKQDLWKKAKRKNTYYVGFVAAIPEQLDGKSIANPLYDTLLQKKALLASNPCYQKLSFLLSPQGQNYLETLLKVMKKPLNQEVIIELMRYVHQFFADIAPDTLKRRSLDEINQVVDDFQQQSEVAGELVCFQNLQQLDAALHPYIPQLLFLSLLSEQVLMPILSRSEAIGNVMRKQIKPVMDPIINSVQSFLV